MNWTVPGGLKDRGGVVLDKLLDYSSAGYQRHTDWFVRHRESSLRQLAAVTTAELLILRYIGGEHLPSVMVVAVLLGLSMLAFVMGAAGIRSCRRSFLASLEHAMMTAKVMWAITSLQRSDDPGLRCCASTGPGQNDDTIYVPRYAKDATQFDSTDSFVSHHMGLQSSVFSRPHNTLFWAEVSIRALVFLAMFVGLAGAAWLAFVDPT